MAVKYSKFFTVTGAITLEPVTILVELVEADGFRGVSIESLEGEYHSSKEFDKASGVVLEETKVSENKMHNFLPMMLPDVHKLVDTLNEALAASKEG